LLLQGPMKGWRFESKMLFTIAAMPSMYHHCVYQRFTKENYFHFVLMHILSKRRSWVQCETSIDSSHCELIFAKLLFIGSTTSLISFDMFFILSWMVLFWWDRNMLQVLTSTQWVNLAVTYWCQPNF
jgi:hypothetical protein